MQDTLFSAGNKKILRRFPMNYEYKKRQERKANIIVGSVLILFITLIMFLFGNNNSESTIYGWWERKYNIGSIERVQQSFPSGGMIMSGNTEILFSSTILLKSNKKMIPFTTVDRQFTGVKKGDCMKVSYDPYAPWALGKNGTFHNGRLLEFLPKKMCQ